MNRTLVYALFATGMAALAWVGWGFLGSSPLALAVTLGISAVYVLGAYELQQFRRATASLTTALVDAQQSVPGLDAWIARIHPALQNTVRQRIEGERVALPGPALTPYLVGLLVMLGMLGTFLGMVVTFQGAVFALEGSADLQAMRSALSAPIKGLGLSFGTSVAGVAASAVLGLLSAICRRERLLAARLLDARIATGLHAYSRAYQRGETLKALQSQATVLPTVMEGLQNLMAHIEQRHRQLDERLSARQAQFHDDVTVAYTRLAHSVGESLRGSVHDSARLAAESIQPVVAAAMAEIASESARQHIRTHEAMEMQLSGVDRALTSFAQSFEQRSRELVEGARDAVRQLHMERASADAAGYAAWTHALETMAAQTQHQTQRNLDGIGQLLQRSEELVRSRLDSDAQWMQHTAERMNQLSSVWSRELGALRDAEAAHGQAAIERLGELQAALAMQLATLGASLEAPVTRLMETAAQAPRAAAELISHMRQEMVLLSERDNRALEERGAVMERFSAVIANAEQSATQQRAAVESLVSSATEVLAQAGTRLAQTLDAQSIAASDVAVHLRGSAIELSALGESFQHAVALFSETNGRLVESLQRVEAAVSQSMARSDEQLAYYVGQAREVIDLSLSAQNAVVEDLRRLQGQQAALATEAR